ncbi:MAG: hypothetical protein IJ875_07210 [Solobacterium sp.]|nr:hypothetical protein [Solobacterium sp.]
MAKIRYDIDNANIQMVMVLKLSQLKREELPTLSYGQFEAYLMESLWKNKLPTTLHSATDDIMHVSAMEIVRFLSRRAIVEGAHQDLSDFTDVIGG